MTQLNRELFASSEGALIDQSFALTQGMCYVVAAGDDNSQELYDVLGHQRGWEILTDGVDEPPHDVPALRRRSHSRLAQDGVELADAPAAARRGPARSTVVTDPHYNTLVSHEIVGHPVELDRALKMETAYAGRSWLLQRARRHPGRPAGRLAAGDGLLRSLAARLRPLRVRPRGHPRPARGPHRPRHLHGLHEQPADRGRLRRRAQRPLEGDGGAAGAADPHVEHGLRRGRRAIRATSSREVDHGYYLVGHKIPSIAESRENFRISARKVYEIRDGRLGRLYRDGGIMADTRDYLMKVDAVGTRLPALSDPQLRQGISPCRPRSSATAAPPCGAAPS